MKIAVGKINNWVESRAKHILRWRWVIIGVYIALMLLAIPGLMKFKTDSSFDAYFLADDPMLVKTAEFQEIFGNDNFVAVLTECDNSFESENLQLIRDLSRELLDSIPYADKVMSITDLDFLNGTEEGINIEPLFPETIPNDKEELEIIRQRLLAKPHIAERLLSDDGRYSWIILRLKAFPKRNEALGELEDLESPKFAVGRETEHIITKTKYTNIAPKASGLSYFTYKDMVWLSHETSLLMIIALIVATIILSLSTRSVLGVILPLTAAISSIVLTYSFFGYIGNIPDLAIIIVPILVSFAVTIAYNVHISSYFRREFRISGDRHQAIINTVGELAWPILFSALTTIMALLSFLVVKVKPLHFAGYATAMAIAISFIITMLLYPALLSFGKNRVPCPIYKKDGATWEERRLEKLGIWVLGHSRSIIIVSSLIAIISFIGVFRIEATFDFEKTLGRRIDFVKEALEICETDLASMYSYEVMIEFPENGAAKQPENLSKLDSLALSLADLELTKRSTSINDIIKDMNKSLNENREEKYILPSTAEELAQLLLLYENAGGSETEYWIDYDYRFLRLMVEIKGLDTGKSEVELAQAQARAKELFPEAEVQVVGSLPQLVAMMQYVSRGQISAFLTALIVIAVLLSLVFGSVRVGLVGMIPNIAPALVVGGIMGWFGIPLDMMTATIIPMILGLAVDDTIHFINHGSLEFERVRNYRKSILRSFRVVGLPLVITTIIISGNFSTYMASSANNYCYMGFLAVTGMITALLADLCITPIIFKHFKIFGEENPTTNSGNAGNKQS